MLALIVDDDPLFCSFLRKKLKDSSGVCSIVCHSAVEGYDILSKNVFDLVFLDNHISGSDLKGSNFWAFLMENRFQHTRIVGMSADSRSKNDFALNGVGLFLHKPFRDEELSTIIDEIVNSRSKPF